MGVEEAVCGGFWDGWAVVAITDGASEVLEVVRGVMEVVPRAVRKVRRVKRMKGD